MIVGKGIGGIIGGGDIMGMGCIGVPEGYGTTDPILPSCNIRNRVPARDRDEKEKKPRCRRDAPKDILLLPAD
jgi:hypothetical protein